jgi:hypothetical protein
VDLNGGLLVLGGLWLLFNLLKKLGQTQRPPSEAPPLQERPRALDATQLEGSRLESVLREFQRAMETVEVEEGNSLEVEPEVRSLEGDVRRAGRQLVDQDEEAEQIEARRIKAAADRDAPRVQADHVRLDQRLRPEVTDHTATRAYTAQQLRHAVVWREILGPPASER